MKRCLQILGFFCVLALAFFARCHNLRDVFVEGRIYFVDADCYSRMTRARMVAEHPGTIVRHHDFENFPQGVQSHTTAPLDYLIVGLEKVLDFSFWLLDREKQSVLRVQTLDLAGALISPLLGVAGAAFLIAWAWALRLRFWAMAGIVFAISPMLVHGTVLGRPDHQSLLIFLLLVALGAELALVRKTAQAEPRLDADADGSGATKADPSASEVAGFGSRRFWGIVAGAAWALSLWVSLYEPLALLAVTMALWLAFDRRSLFDHKRRAGWLVFALILGVAFLLEGWRIQAPDAAMRAYFGNWTATIGELSHLDWQSPLLFRWFGWLMFAAPVLLILRRRADRLALPALTLLVVAFALTIWQLRWGYFLGVVFVLALPIFMCVFRRTWIAWAVFFLALWPVAQDWDAQLFPDENAQRDVVLKRAENVALREIVSTKAEANGEPAASEPHAFLAPWWLSPSIAYWTRQPGVAGSSHESLAGIVDSARIFLAPDAAAALPLLQAHRVAWILADAPERVVPTSATLLGVTPPEKCLAQELAEPFVGDPATALVLPEPKNARSPHTNFFRVWNVRGDSPQ